MHCKSGTNNWLLSLALTPWKPEVTNDVKEVLASLERLTASTMDAVDTWNAYKKSG